MDKIIAEQRSSNAYFSGILPGVLVADLCHFITPVA